MWTIRHKDTEAGPYSTAEVTELIKRGLHDAVIRTEGGPWAHLSLSPFSQYLPKRKTHTAWTVAAVLGVIFLLSTCSVVVVFK